MYQCDDCGKYFRVPPDTRDLNYNKYFVEGESEITIAEDYNSENTKRLNVEETKELLLTLDYIQQELNNYNS